MRFRGATGPVTRTARSPTGHLILRAYKSHIPYIPHAHQGAASFDFLARAGGLTDDTCGGALASAGADLPESQGRAGLRAPLLGNSRWCAFFWGLSAGFYPTLQVRCCSGLACAVSSEVFWCPATPRVGRYGADQRSLAGEDRATCALGAHSLGSLWHGGDE